MAVSNVFSSADILLPKNRNGADGSAYSVIACDQFTSEPEFWSKCEKIAKDKPSTLNLILPEAYLDRADELIPKINSEMEVYLENHLESFPNSMIYLRRMQPDGRVRCGIIGKIDLECYNFLENSSSLIRPTEKTVVERIPPRVKIREGASIELPHIMLLINDPSRSLIEPLEKEYENFDPAYDFDLMMGAGHVSGYFIGSVAKRRINALLGRYSTAAYCNKLYNVKEKKPLLFAVGDGNHSLASAKAVYENLKAEYGKEAKKMPQRYALVEIVNIHDPALDFEPIYRIVKCSSKTEVDELCEYIKIAAKNSKGENDPYTLTLVRGTDEETIEVSAPTKNLPVAFVQELLDEFENEHTSAVTDYIHGEDSLLKLAETENTVGILFKGMDKSDLFKSIVLDGVLPRKTFSMGHALDKRHYLEARMIKNNKPTESEEKNMDKYSIETKCIQSGYKPDNGEPRTLPIAMSTTYKYDSSEHLGKLFDLKVDGHMYTRISNPTVSCVEDKIADLEGGTGALLTSSGQAANLIAILNIAQAGDNIVSMSSIYGGTVNLFAVTLKKMGIETRFAKDSMTDTEIEALIDDRTRLFFGETIANPALTVFDFDRYVPLAHKHNIPVVIDNTFATPVLCRPFELGADIVVHSTTKYMDGHATVVGGVVVDGGKFNWENGKYPELTTPDDSYHGVTYTRDFGNDKAYITKARVQLMRDFGIPLSPMSSFILNLGLETLALRVERHSANALAIAKFLEANEYVDWVNYPLLESNSEYEKASKYLNGGASGVISFGVKGGREAAMKFMDSLKLAAIVVHVADARTSVLHPASTTHRQLTDEQLINAGVGAELVRLSVGIENVNDIIADVKQALEASQK